MKKLLLAAAALVALAGSANASGWQAYYDCGNKVVPIITGWRGKMWLSLYENHKAIFDDKKFYDGGVDTLEEHPQPLNADVSDFRFQVKLNGRTVILRYRRVDGDDKAVTFAGHSCRFMGTGYDDEVKRYNGEDR